MRGFTVAVALSLACAGGAAGCYWKVHTLRADSGWVMARATAQADEYVESFDGSLADRELATLDEYRAVLERAHGWERGQELFVIAAVLALFAAYLLRVLGRVEEVGPDGRVLAPVGAPVPVTAAVESAAR